LLFVAKIREKYICYRYIRYIKGESTRQEKIPESPVNFKSYFDERNCNSIFLDAILESEVAKAIGQLKVTKSCGYDEMSPKVIRGISNHIVKPLTHIQSIPSYWLYSR